MLIQSNIYKKNNNLCEWHHHKRNCNYDRELILDYPDKLEYDFELIQSICLNQD